MRSSRAVAVYLYISARVSKALLELFWHCRQGHRVPLQAFSEAFSVDFGGFFGPAESIVSYKMGDLRHFSDPFRLFGQPLFWLRDRPLE